VDNFQETFGISVVEAMAAGLPVILSDFSGYREFVADGQEGFLIPTTGAEELPEFLAENTGVLDPSIVRLYSSQAVAVDLEALREAVLALLNNESLRREMGGRARSRASFYRWSKIVPACEEFWADLKKESLRHLVIPEGKVDILTGDAGGTFSHFPSMRLSGRHKVSLTEAGLQAKARSTPFTRYEDVQACLSPDLEYLILSSLSSGARSVAELRQSAAGVLQAARGRVDFHILWLLKHGALKIEGAIGSDRSD
jgi:hypothetical protein